MYPQPKRKPFGKRVNKRVVTAPMSFIPRPRSRSKTVPDDLFGEVALEGADTAQRGQLDRCLPLAVSPGWSRLEQIGFCELGEAIECILRELKLPRRRC